MPVVRGHMPVITGFDVLRFRKRDKEEDDYYRMRRCAGGFAIALLEVQVLELDVDVRYDAETFHQVFTWAHHPDLYNVKSAPSFTYREPGTLPEDTIRVANKAGNIMFGGVEYGPSEYEHDEEYVDPPQCASKTVKTMVANINAITSSVPPTTPSKKVSNEGMAEESLWAKKRIIERLATQGLSSEIKSTQEDYWVEAYNAAFPEMEPDVLRARIAAMKFKEGTMIKGSSWNDKWHSFDHLSKKTNIQLKAPMLLGLSKGYEHFMNTTALVSSPNPKTEVEALSNAEVTPVAIESKLHGADVSPQPAKPNPFQSKYDAEPKFIPASTAFTFERIIKEGKTNAIKPISENVFGISNENGPEENSQTDPEESSEIIPEESSNALPPSKKEPTFYFEMPEDWAEDIRRLFRDAPEDTDVTLVNEQDHSEHAKGIPPPPLPNNLFASTGYGFMCAGEKLSGAFDFSCPVKSSSELAKPVAQETLSFKLGNPVTTAAESSVTSKAAVQPMFTFKSSEEFFGAVMPSLSPKKPVATPHQLTVKKPLLIPAKPSVTSAEPPTITSTTPAAPDLPVIAPGELTTTIQEPATTPEEHAIITLPLRPVSKTEFASFAEFMEYTKANPPVCETSSEYSTDDDYDDAGSDAVSVGSDDDEEYDEESLTSDEVIALEMDLVAHHEEDGRKPYEEDDDDVDSLYANLPKISKKAPEVINAEADLVAHHEYAYGDSYEQDDDVDSLYADPPNILKKAPVAEVLSPEAEEQEVDGEDVASLRELLPFELIWPKENETLKPLCDVQLPPLQFDVTPLGEMLGLTPQLPPLEFEETSFGEMFGKEAISASSPVAEQEEKVSEVISKSSPAAAKTAGGDMSLTSVSIDILGWVQEEIQALSQLATTVCEQVSVLKTTQHLDESAAPTREIKSQLDKNIGRLIQRGFSSNKMGTFFAEDQMPPAHESIAATNTSSQHRLENLDPSSSGPLRPLI